MRTSSSTPPERQRKPLREELHLLVRPNQQTSAFNLPKSGNLEKKGFPEEPRSKDSLHASSSGSDLNLCVDALYMIPHNKCIHVWLGCSSLKGRNC